MTGLDLSQKNQVVDGRAQRELESSLGYKKREEAGLNNLVSIGSLNLHVVYATLKSATEETKWNL